VQLPDDLHEACRPLAWLLGRWRGLGLGEYPGVEAFRCWQELDADHVPREPAVRVRSRIWVVDEDARPTTLLVDETSYWRPQPDGNVEVVLARMDGVVEVYLGELGSARAELATRGVLVTESGPPYRAAHRLYGLVDGRLMWVLEQAADGHALQPYVHGELRRS